MVDLGSDGERDANLALVADRLRAVEDLIGDREPLLGYLVRMAYIAALEALDAARRQKPS